MSNYIALYRKWRPKVFADVVGQEHITNVLASEVRNGSVSHAYLFCGSRGTGKTTCAKILAKAVNCDATETGDPCGECEGCRLSESSFDIVEMDAASNNGVDEIRRLREEVMYPPTEMKRKVYIIDEVHMLSASAFNALLKTLEEPPEHVLFILATTELNKIPATILSRCKRFDFHRITPESIFGRLKTVCEAEGINASDGALKLISRLATGAMRDALSMLELFVGSKEEIDEKTAAEILGVVGRDTVLSLMTAVGKKDTSGAIRAISEVHDFGKDLGVLCSECSELLRDLLMVKYMKDPEEYVENLSGGMDALKECAELYTAERLVFCSEVLEDAAAKMARGTFSRRMCLEAAVLRMCDVRLSEIPEAVISRISELELKVKRLEGQLASGKFVSAPVEKASVPVENSVPTPAPEPVRPEIPVDDSFAAYDIPPEPDDAPPFDLDDAIIRPKSAPKANVSDKSEIPFDVPFDIPSAPIPTAGKIDLPFGTPDEAPKAKEVEAPRQVPDAEVPPVKKPSPAQTSGGVRKHLDAFPEIVNELKSKDVMFNAFLNTANAYFEGETVKIELAPFAYSFITKSNAKVDMITDAVEKFVGFRPQVVLVPMNDGKKSGSAWDL